MATTRRQRITRLIALAVRWGAGTLMVALLVSWALSRSHRHGVIFDGLRRYAISSVDGSIELRHVTRTDLDYTTGQMRIKELPFAPPDRRFDITWYGAAGPTNATFQPLSLRLPSWPTLVVKRSLWPQSAEAFSGGEAPVVEPPAADGRITVSYVKFGEQTRVTFVPLLDPRRHRGPGLRADARRPASLPGGPLPAMRVRPPRQPRPLPGMRDGDGYMTRPFDWLDEPDHQRCNQKHCH